MCHVAPRAYALPSVAQHRAPGPSGWSTLLARDIAILLAAIALVTGQALPQQAAKDSSSDSTSKARKRWRYSFSIEGFIPAEGESLINPTLTADRDWVHLEARYNYEAKQTGSAWMGYNFHVGHAVSFQATPMIGGVVGNITGVAVGLEYVLSYQKLELASEQEFVYDARNSSDSFFYVWPELTYSPLDWFSFGIVAQRTRLYKSSLDVQRGVLVVFSYRMLQFTPALLNAGWTTPTWVLTLSVAF